MNKCSNNFAIVLLKKIMNDQFRLASFTHLKYPNIEITV
jgi:hypothetical protein